MVTEEAKLSQKSQQTGEQHFQFLPGNKMIVSTPEGGVLTYVGGQLVSSKTASQVALESQIASSVITRPGQGVQYGIEITPEISEQIAIGLQQQTKEALLGQTPGSFIVETPEAKFSATSGITPNALAGATGSVIPKGYMQGPLGNIVPRSQKFKTSTGQEFIAEPIGTSDRPKQWSYGELQEQLIWKTPYGEIISTPGFLEKNIERTLSIQALTPMLQAGLEEESLINERASRLETGMAYGLYHPFETAKGLLSYAFPLFGETREEIQLELWKQRKDWTAQMMGLGPVTGIGLESAKLGGELFLATAGGPILRAVGSKVPDILQPVLTGAGLGLTTGLTAIGTIEAEKGIEEKSTQRFWGGTLLAGMGAVGTKAVWETGVVPELEKAFPSKTLSIGKSISNIEFKQEDLVGGEGTGLYDTKLRGKEILSKADFKFLGKSIDDEVSVSIEGGKMESKLVEPRFLGFGKKVTDLDDVMFGTEAITKQAPNENFFISMFESVTPKTNEMGLGISEKIFEGPSETVFRTFAETKTGRILSVDKIRDITGLPGAEWSQSGDLLTGTSLDFDKGSIAKAVQKDILGMHESLVKGISAPSEPSLIPTIFPSGPLESKSKTKEDVFSIPNIKIESLEKELNISGITGASSQILELEPITSGKELTGLWEGPRTERLFPDITTDITSSLQLTTQITTPIETPLETPISLPKTSMLTPGPITPIITPFIEPFPMGFVSPEMDFGFSEEPFRKGKGGGGRGFLDAPSWVALELNIHGKMPGNLTGLEIRPITGKKSRRKGSDDDFLKVEF